MLEEEYKIQYFIENDFTKKKCIKCGNIFWTQNEQKMTCGDTPCDTYEFIGKPIFKNNYTLESMRKHYIEFFKERGHTHIDRYPVIARWRNDIYLTIASIADFQPFVTSGLAQPPANPLVISQPCIRLNDIDSVGRTGRHLTTFEMMAHHVFNTQNKEYYWKDQTIKLCNDLLLNLGAKKEEITYIENPWSGGGNAGASVEVMVSGLELATLVFMNLKESKYGTINVKNKYYQKMDNYIVDTGYGLERFVWASQGSPTIYDSLFPQILNELTELSDTKRDSNDERYIQIFSENAKLAGIMDVSNAKSLLYLRKKVADKINMDVQKLNSIMNPIEKLYAIVDHTRCLTFMLGDGIIPSNVKSGYLARLVIRKTLKFMNDIGLSKKISLYDIIKLHMDQIPEYKEFRECSGVIEEILDIETKKYNLMLNNGEKIIKKEIENYKHKNVSTEKLVEFYDTHGIPPEVAINIAKKFDVNIDFQDNFYSLIADKHNEIIVKEKAEFKYIQKIQHLPITRKMYYDEPERYEFEAVVLEIFDNFIVLDSTLFYPEGGGQDSDNGTITSGIFSYDVINVQVKNEIIIHEIEIKENGIFINKGDIIVGQVNKNRRIIHTKHHTATHIINEAAKRILGKYIWQAGSQITMQGARLDITHYKKITQKEQEQIEKIANKIVMENKKIQFEILERTEAEQKYGFSLYQGGVPSGKNIRIVKIGTDIEACAGTHCLVTGNIGIIKIIKIDRIQDGIERIEFKAGETAIEYIQQQSELIDKSCEKLNVTNDILLKTIGRFFDEWKKQKKEIEKLKLSLSKYKCNEIISLFHSMKNINFGFYYEDNLTTEDLKCLAYSILEQENIICLLCTTKNDIFNVIIVLNIKNSFYIGYFNAINIMKTVLLDRLYSGGGNNRFATALLKEKVKTQDEAHKIYNTIKNNLQKIIYDTIESINN